MIKSAFQHLFTTHLAQFVYGAIDGTVTTFAVVAGAAGAGLDVNIILILGIANLVGDGFSMGASAYLSNRSETQQAKKAIKLYREKISHNDDSIRRSLEKHFRCDYNFEGEQLESALDTALQDEQRVIRHLLREQFGKSEIHDSRRQAFTPALATFIAFVGVGLVPLLPYLFGLAVDYSKIQLFFASLVATVLAFLGIGYLKGFVTHTSKHRSSGETLFLGAIAAALAFIFGSLLEKIIT